MSTVTRCDYCGKERPTSKPSHGWMRLEPADHLPVPGSKYPPLPRDYCSWECVTKYMADVVRVAQRAS